MKRCCPWTLALLIMTVGCARDLKIPEIPEYHPANARATQAPRIEAFDVLAVVPAPPPELPVPEGEQLSPEDPQKKMGGMDKMGESSDGMEAPAAHEPVAGPGPMEGVVRREGMREGMPEGTPSGPFPTDHPPPQDAAHRQDLDDDIERGEAAMQSIKIPTEQRGMGADSTLYHEHKHHDSTHITHPNRYTSHIAIVGTQVWACPVHPQIAVDTPGGRCPKCDTVLVPVKVGSP